MTETALPMKESPVPNVSLPATTDVAVNDPCFRSLIEAMVDVVFTTDTAFRISYVAPSVQLFLGFLPAQLLGHTVTHLIAPSWRDRVMTFFADVLERRLTNARYEYPVVDQRGNECWVEVTTRLLTEGEQVTGLVGVMRDMADRKRIETERLQWVGVVESAHDAILSTTVDGIIDGWNAGAERLYGYTAEEAVGKSISILFPPGTEAELSSIRERFTTGQRIEHFETVRVRKDGSRRHVSLVLSPKYDAAGVIIGVASFIRDITGQKQLELEVRQREAQLSEAQRVAHIGSWEWDISTNVVTWSDELYRIFGLQTDDFSGSYEAFLEGIHPEDRAELDRTIRASYQSLEPFRFQHRIVRSDGTVGILEGRGRVIVDASGSPIRMMGTGQDVTEQKQAEKALEHEHDLLRALIDNSPDYIFIKDREGRFILSNTAHSQAGRGITPDGLIGKTAFELFPSDLAAQFDADDRAVLHSGQSQLNLERETVDKDGNRRWVLTTKVALRDRSGEVIGLIGMSRDITDRKQAESQALELEVEKAKIQLITDFIQNASHDLKTPLSVVNTSVYLAGRAVDENARQRHLKEIEAQVQDLTRIIEELLIMTSLDATTEFELMAVDVNEMVGQVVTGMNRRMTEKALHVRCALDSSNPVIHGDQRHLAQSIGKLLDNAILYTPLGGTVTITTTRHEHTMMIEVQDTGIGIGDNDRPYIFERFYKANKARTYDHSGPGLGLSMVKKIVELHQGAIEVESELGAGSTFRILLPIRQDGYDQPSSGESMNWSVA